MTNPLLRISDGTTTVNLLANRDGFGLAEWYPQIAPLKDGGVYSGNVMVDNRQLIHGVFDNVVETFNLRLHSRTQDKAIENTQKLRRLLQKAREYWTTVWQREPVWIEARAPNETNTRYALIHNWETPGDANPFAQPFFSCPAIMDEFTLVVERGHWLSNPPGESECAMISGNQNFDEAGAGTGVTENTTEGVGEGEDVSDYVDVTGGGWMTYTADVVELSSMVSVFHYHGVGSVICNGSARFVDVDIPRNAKISAASITLTGVFSTDANNMEIHISAFYTKNPHQLLTVADWEEAIATRTDEVVWTVGAIVDGTPYTTPDLSDMIQEMVDRVDWEEGDAIIILFLYGMDDVTGTKGFSGFNYGGRPNPQLYVEFQDVVSSTYGQTETCTEDVVFVANKHNRANISAMFRYDDSLGSWSGNLIQGAEGMPYILLPTTPAVGDALYVGVNTGLFTYGPFCNVIFDIGTAATGVYGHWEYYNGAWVDLPVRDEMRNALGAGFTTTGVKGVFFSQQVDWDGMLMVNGVQGYWIRYIVDTVTTPTHPHQQNRNPYTVIWPFFEIAEDEISGDLPCLTKVIVKNRSQSTTSPYLYLGATRVIMGLRNCDRGDDFSAYINLRGGIESQQNPFGVYCIPESAMVVTYNSNYAPSGKVFRFNPSDGQSPTGMVLGFRVDFLGQTLTQYTGTYRCFIRVRRESGALGTTRVKIATVFGEGDPENYSETITLPFVGIGWILADMGIIKIYPRLWAGAEEAAQFSINVYVENTDANAVDIHFVDMILMPVDEWVGDFRFTNDLKLSSQFYNDPRLWVDSLGDMSQELRVIGVNQSDHIITTLSKINSGSIFLQANKKQRMWFLFDDCNLAYPGISDINVCHSVTVRKNQRYFSMRGNR